MQRSVFPRLAAAFVWSASVALAACSNEHAPSKPAAVPVTVTRAVARDMPVLATAPGSVETINSVAVRAQIEGQLLESLVKDGADVARDQLLFRIDPRPAQAALQQAQSTLAKDQATLTQARSQVERYQDVAAKGYISADQMEQYRTNLGVALAAVKVDEANVAAAKLTLGYTQIRAPIAGRIGRILIQPGNVVTTNDVNPLVVINQVEPIYVNFALPSSLLGRLLAAQKQAPLAVKASVIGIDEPVEGKIAFVDNAVDTTTGTIKLRGEFANAGHVLWPGQLVGVSLTLGHDANAVVLPDAAVQNGPNGTYVFVVKADEHAEQRPVKVARIVEGQAVVESGLAVGETVVLDGQSRVEDGVQLKIDAPAGAGQAAEAAR
ncbi:efflux RND transporter periplasmic adaptor subunit [Dokdonella ginsengisoli]|uniref:Efflux RND transporter periplasmic adaptor subunit n=1 Tax=Dokdonella ginsengisoli TaxID=363846 RepID=A0ABV9QT39_9GAMM